MRPSAIREILKLTDGGSVLSLAGGLPAGDLFPIDDVATATERALTTNGLRALQYGPSNGLAELREWVAAQRVGAVAERIIITSGSQQGLDLIAKVLLDPGDKVAISAPTYMGALRAFDPYQPEYLPVAMDEEGMTPASLDEALTQGAKFVYLVPDFDNPSGRRATLERRRALLDVCDRHDVLIVEDAPYRELRFDDTIHPPMFELAPDRVVHVGSLSKTLAPGLRIAWLILPEAMVDTVEQAKQAMDLHTSTFGQAVAYELVKDGALEARFPGLRTYYRRQRDLLTKHLQERLADLLHFTSPSGGMFLWARLPEGMDATELLKQAIGQGVAFVPGESFYPREGEANTLRLSYSLLDDAGFAEATERLARAMDAYQIAAA